MSLEDDLADPLYKDPVFQGLMAFFAILGLGLLAMAWVG
jgi:hypothetical protein